MTVVAVEIVEVIASLITPYRYGGAQQGQVSAHGCVISERGHACCLGRLLFEGNFRLLCC